MKELVKAFDDLPIWLKFVLALPGIDGIAYGIYRIAKGVDQKDNVMLIVGILWIVAGFFLLWIIDMVSVLLYGNVKFFA